jgi:hypothetical protein
MAIGACQHSDCSGWAPLQARDTYLWSASFTAAVQKTPGYTAGGDGHRRSAGFDSQLHDFLVSEPFADRQRGSPRLHFQLVPPAPSGRCLAGRLVPGAIGRLCASITSESHGFGVYSIAHQRCGNANARAVTWRDTSLMLKSDA